MSSHNGKSGRQDGDGKHPANEEGEPLTKKLRSEQSPAASVEENQASEQRGASDMDEPFDASYSLLDAATDGNVRAIKIRLAEGADLEEEDMDGRTSLALAILNKRMRAVELLVAEGADIYAHWEDEYDALHLACEVGLVRAIPLLVSKGASVHDAGNEFGETPLHRAAACGEVAAMRALVEMGAKIDALDGAQRTPFHSAAVWGELAAMEFLESKGWDIQACDINGLNTLQCVAKEGSGQNMLLVVKWLVRRGLDLESKNADEYTALHLAALHSNKAAAAALIREGAIVDSKNDEEVTPFHCAAVNGSTQIMELLRVNGADIFAVDKWQNTALHLVAKMNMRFNVASVINYLATHGADINKAIEESYGDQTQTPMVLAVNAKNHEAIAALSALGANHDNAKMGALAEAARSGALTSMEMLLAGGAEPNIEGKMVPLHQAAYDSGRPALDLLFAHGAVVGVRGTNGETEMHWAAANATPATLAFLMSKGSAVSEVDNDGRTPLHFAARGGCAANIRFLIHNGADIEAASTDGWRALHEATYEYRFAAIDALIRLGATVDVMSDRGTSLHIAAAGGVCSVIATLLMHGASTAILDKDGKTPLHRACEVRKTAIFLRMMDRMPYPPIPIREAERIPEEELQFPARSAINTLIEVGRADIEASSHVGGQRPLHIAVIRSSLEAIEALIAKGAFLEGKDSSGCTPLHLAAHKASLECCALLVAKGSNIHATSREGYTPLHYSVYGHHLANEASSVEIIDLLAKRGVNINAANELGVTPLHLAAAAGYTLAIKALLRHGAKIDAIAIGGRTPLHWAAERGRLKAIKVLKSKGALIGSVNGGPSVADSFFSGNPPCSLEDEAKICQLLEIRNCKFVPKK